MTVTLDDVIVVMASIGVAVVSNLWIIAVRLKRIEAMLRSLDAR